MVNTTDTIGIVGGILIILSLLPQLLLLIRNKSSKDISILTYSILFIAQILWMTYGFLKNDYQVLFTNLISGIITVFIIIFACYYRYKDNYT
jgi:MtN3 and saliva related transmembrane protein